MATFVSFLRGINVSGNKTIRMDKLKGLYEALGLAPVRTLLNSGNVVFAAKGTGRAELAKTIEDAVEKQFGFRPAIVIRSASELKAILEKNPFADVAKSDPSHLLVMTLAKKPKAGAKARIAEAYSGPEEIAILGENVYLTYPNGIGKSKLTNTLLEKQLGVVGTARTWNTPTKLLALSEQVENA